MVLRSIFAHKSFILHDVKLAELSNNSDILGVKTYSDPSYVFSGSQDPQPPWSTPCQLDIHCHLSVIDRYPRKRVHYVYYDSQI